MSFLTAGGNILASLEPIPVRSFHKYMNGFLMIPSLPILKNKRPTLPRPLMIVNKPPLRKNSTEPTFVRFSNTLSFIWFNFSVLPSLRALIVSIP